MEQETSAKLHHKVPTGLSSMIDFVPLAQLFCLLRLALRSLARQNGRYIYLPQHMGNALYVPDIYVVRTGFQVYRFSKFTYLQGLAVRVSEMGTAWVGNMQL